MKLQSILDTLALLAGTGAALAGCSSKPASHATEVPVAPATATSSVDGEECLHADGCCGGHTPGDATCGEGKAKTDGDPGSDPASIGAWSRTWTIAPGGMAEINLELAAGEAMTARFSTEGGGPLKWNVHSHEGDEAVIHAQGSAASGGPRHVAAKAGMYSFLWKNDGAKAVQLTVMLEEAASKVHSTHPSE